MTTQETKPSIRSVMNAFSALEFITERTLENEGASLEEIAKHLDMQKTTARNLMQTMELCGYVDRKGFGFYALGEKCKTLIMAAESSNRMRDLSIPVLSSFSRKLELSVHLSVFYNGKRYTSLSMDSRGVPASQNIGDNPENVYRRAATRLLLAHATAEGVKGFLKRYGNPSPESWREGADDLEEALRQIRQEKIAVNEHNMVHDVTGVAVGIFNGHGKLCAALSVSPPNSQWQGERKKNITAELKKAAEELSAVFSTEQLM